PGPIGLPTGEPLVDRLPGPIALGQVPPGDPGADPEQDDVEDLAVISPPPTPPGRHRWQQRRQSFPLLVGNLESSAHARLLPHRFGSTQTPPPIRETRPSGPELARPWVAARARIACSPSGPSTSRTSKMWPQARPMLAWGWRVHQASTRARFVVASLTPWGTRLPRGWLRAG